MKKLLLIITILWFSNFAKAQVTYFDYLDYTSEWRYYYSGWAGLYFEEIYRVYSFNGDTIINTNPYYKQYRTEKVISHFSNPPAVTYYTYGPVYIREDNQKRFLYYDAITNSDKVYYDFQSLINSSIGDSMTGYGYKDNCLISYINTVTLGGRTLKQIVAAPNSPSQDGMVEGIGRVGFNCAIGVEGNEKLVCYKKQGNYAYFNNFNNTVHCDSFPEANFTTIAEQSLNNIVVFPNPSKAIFTITNIKQNSLIEIMDVSGRVIYSEKIMNAVCQLDLSDKAKGIYFYKIVSENNLIGQGKLILH